MFDPLYSQNNEIFLDISDFIPSTQLEGDQILPTFDQHNSNNNLDNLLNQAPTYIDNPTLKPNPEKRPLAIDHHDEENNGMNPNDSKKKQKIMHREIERKRRLVMSSLHTSLKSLLPVEYIKGKRSMSDHLGEAVKYIKQMQQKMQELNKKRDALREEVSNYKGHKFDNVDEVIVNVLKESVEVIVSTNCRENDGNEGQGLPLSKVLKCLIEEGLDVVSSSSKRVNTNLVHSIHAQVGEEDKIVIDATNLKNKIADIKR